MSKTLKAAASHHDREVAELRADRELTVEYLKAALESLDDPDDRAAGLLALRTVAEADATAHLRPIHDEKSYGRMVDLMNILLDTTGDDEDHLLSDLLDLVGDMVSKYEQEHYAINPAEDILEQRRQARLEKSRKDAELMQLHKVVADVIDKPDAADVRARALAQIDKWELNALCNPRYVALWRDILNLPAAAMRTALLRDDAEGVAMRQSSPFGFLKDEDE